MAKRDSKTFPVLMAILLGGIIAACLIWILSFQPAVRPEQSAFGFDGLRAWLAENDIPARRFSGGGQLDADGVGLRILPLMDDRTDTYAGGQSTTREAYLRSEIRRMWETVVDQKVENIPTLVVLAKWRDGVRLGGAIHPDFLLPDTPEPSEPEGSNSSAETGLGERNAESDNETEPVESEIKSARDGDGDVEGFAGEGETILMDAELEFSDIQRVSAVSPFRIEQVDMAGYLSGPATLYAPQYASAPEQCRALIGSLERGLLFACTLNGAHFWVLSDPDLLNNHGLPRGENAALALELIQELAHEGSILIDYSTQVWALPEHDTPGRSLADLLRYFEPPFAWLWLAGLGFLVVLLWRGGVRGVPLVQRFTEGHGAARRTALAAQARLMRRARADGALLKTLTTSYVNTLAERMLGRDSASGNRRDRVIRVLRHRDAVIADDFSDALQTVDALPDDAGSDQTIPALSRLHSAYKKALKLT